MYSSKGWEHGSRALQNTTIKYGYKVYCVVEV